MNQWRSLGVTVLVVSGVARAGQLDPGLEAVLQQAAPNETVSALFMLNERISADELDLQLDAMRADLRTRHEIVVRALQDTAAATQGAFVAEVQAMRAAGRVDKFEAFWITNVIRVDAARDNLLALAQHPDVERVYFNPRIELIRPVEGRPAPNNPQPVGTIEPGIIAVRAPEVWDIGITGEGTLVSTLDTGVDGNHEALASRWRGLDPAYANNPEWAWFDPVTNTTFPQAFGSHGTHTMGSVCGGPPGDQIGVAPGTEWIHAGVIDRVSIAQTVADALLSFQWILDPDGNPATNWDVPDVNSNSWGLADFHGYPDCDPFFWEAIDNCEAAGIVMLFAAGNESFSGIRRPADRATDDYRNFAVGAVNANIAGWPIATFSSRGPVDCGPNGSSAVKPEISAPGDDVRSSTPGNNYGFNSGTSMSTPHICGVVALMRQANPDLPVDEIKQILFDTAVDLGDPGEDNDYGWGMVDAFEAVQQALATVNVTFSFPDGLPIVLDSDGGSSFRVFVEANASAPIPDTGTLYYAENGGSFVEVAMNSIAPNEYEAVFPVFGCPSDVDFYFSVETDQNDMVFNPFTAPQAFYSAEAWVDSVDTFADDFESDQGWLEHGTAGMTGPWERGTPAGDGSLGDPPNDADGSGQCFVTGLAQGEDVDGGKTSLYSPIMDASDPTAVISYWRWFQNTLDATPGDDVLVVEISDDGGMTWNPLETIGPEGPGTTGGWIHVSWLVADLEDVENTASMQIRFDAEDTGNDSVLEAGVDGVRVGTLVCDVPCLDITGDGIVDTLDFLDLLAAWGPNPGHPADYDGNGVVDTVDFLALLSAWGPCP